MYVNYVKLLDSCERGFMWDCYSADSWEVVPHTRILTHELPGKMRSLLAAGFTLRHYYNADTLQLTALLLKSFRLRLHCYTLGFTLWHYNDNDFWEIVLDTRAIASSRGILCRESVRASENAFENACILKRAITSSRGRHSQKVGLLLMQCVNILQCLHCNTLQHNATQCNTLQHTATHCSVNIL